MPMMDDGSSDIAEMALRICHFTPTKIILAASVNLNGSFPVSLFMSDDRSVKAVATATDTRSEMGKSTAMSQWK
jgi:hypothetical protein